MLDIGCGCGRFATALTQHLAPSSRYHGVDIVPEFIDFCRGQITARFPNFNFATIDKGNQFYDFLRGGKPHATVSRLSEVCAARSIDLCIATSLFTHLGVDETIEYLADIRRALKPDGRAILTFFILEPSTRELIQSGLPLFRFPHTAPDGTYVEYKDSPLHAVAFDAPHLYQLIANAGFYVAKIQYGNWVARRGSANFQDVVILRPSPRVIGYLDFATPTGVQGWAAFRDRSETPVEIAIVVDGEPAAKFPARDLRTDLILHGFGMGRHGFAWTPPSPLSPSARIEVFAEGERILTG